MATKANAANPLSRQILVSVFTIATASACSTTEPGVGDASTRSNNTQVAEAAAEQREDDPRVCKLITQVGTKVARRVCVRQSDWDTMQGTGSKVTTDMQNRAVQAGNPTNGG